MQSTATVSNSGIFGSDLTKRKRNVFESSSQSSSNSKFLLPEQSIDSSLIMSLEQKIMQKALILQSKAALIKSTDSSAKLQEINQNGPHPSSPTLQQLMSEDHNELTPKKSGKDMIPTSDDESPNRAPLSMSTADHEEPKCTPQNEGIFPNNWPFWSSAGLKKVNVNSEIFRLSSENNEDLIDEIACESSSGHLESYDTVPEVSVDTDFESQVDTFRIKLIKLEVAVTRMEAENHEHRHQNNMKKDVREAKALNVNKNGAISLENTTSNGASVTGNGGVMSLKQRFGELQAFFMNYNGNGKNGNNSDKLSSKINNNQEQPPTNFKH